MRNFVIALLAACTLMIVAPAYSRDLDGKFAQNPTPQSKWFKDWKNLNGRGCCGDSDCHREIGEDGVRNFKWRIKENSEDYQINFWPGFPDSGWIDVPSYAVNPDVGNPTAGAVSCYMNSTVFCFAPPNSEPPPL
jgi:hypothetical protein